MKVVSLWENAKRVVTRSGKQFVGHSRQSRWLFSVRRVVWHVQNLTATTKHQIPEFQNTDHNVEFVLSPSTVLRVHLVKCQPNIKDFGAQRYKVQFLKLSLKSH